MSSIIDADPFNDVFTATRDNSTMQGVVTAIYELGMCRSFELLAYSNHPRLPWRGPLYLGLR